MKKKDELLKQIERLRAMVEFDCEPEVSEVEKYRKWIDKMQGRVDYSSCKPFDFIPVDPNTYNKWNLLSSMVEDLYNKTHEVSNYAIFDRRECRRLIKEIIAMTMFYEEQL